MMSTYEPKDACAVEIMLSRNPVASRCKVESMFTVYILNLP